MLENLQIGIEAALSVQNVVWCLIGVILGTVIGLLPGLGSATGIAILIPLTLTFDPLTALIMLAGIYHGSEYGAIITAILIATPGEASSVVATLDGYQMARKGRAGQALAIAAVSAFTASMVTVMLMLGVAQALGSLAIGFGPPEILTIMVFGFATVSMFSAGNVLLGLAMCTLGVLFSTVGIDMGTGVARYTMGSVNLFSGLPFVEVMIGLFALGELLNQLGKGMPTPIKTRMKDLLLTKDDFKRSAFPTLRGMIIGFIVGVLPGAGSTLASFLAYGSEKRFSKNRDEIGTGAIEGIASPSAATSAAANGAFVPTLTLGIPGSATTAVLLGAFLLYGITPGPLLFEEQPRLIWGLLVSFLVAHLLLLVLNLPMAPLFAQLLRLRYSFLYPIIIFTAFMGAFAVSNNSFSLWIVLVFGVIGFFMKRLGLPMAPLVLGLVLGPLFEKALVQAAAIGRGSVTSAIAASPKAIVILLATIILLGIPPIMAQIKKRRPQKITMTDQIEADVERAHEEMVAHAAAEEYAKSSAQSTDTTSQDSVDAHPEHRDKRPEDGNNT